MKEIIKRLRLPSPTLFKNISKIGVGLLSLGGSILALETTYQITLPEIVHTICLVLLIVGTTATGISNLTVDWDKVDKDSKTEKSV